MQRHIVQRTLELGASMTTPGTIGELDLHWHHDGWKSNPLGWSRRNEDGERPESSDSSSADSRTARSDVPRYQNGADRLAAEISAADEAVDRRQSRRRNSE